MNAHNIKNFLKLKYHLKGRFDLKGHGISLTAILAIFLKENYQI